MKLSDPIIKKINESKEGQQLREFIVFQIKSLDRVSDIKESLSDKGKAIEITARKRAIETLAKILQPLLDYQEPREPEEPEEY
jgi:hypothetical protein